MDRTLHTYVHMYVFLKKKQAKRKTESQNRVNVSNTSATTKFPNTQK